MIVERVRNSSEETRSDCPRLSWNSRRIRVGSHVAEPFEAFSPFLRYQIPHSHSEHRYLHPPAPSKFRLPLLCRLHRGEQADGMRWAPGPVCGETLFLEPFANPGEGRLGGETSRRRGWRRLVRPGRFQHGRGRGEDCGVRVQLVRVQRAMGLLAEHSRCRVDLAVPFVQLWFSHLDSW